MFIKKAFNLYAVKVILLVLLLSINWSCLPQNQQYQYVNTLFSNDISSFVLEVDYMENATPKTFITGQSNSVWQMTQVNLEALFVDEKNIIIPHNLSEMQMIPSENKNYSRNDLINIAVEYRSNPSIDTSIASLYVLFVDGFFIDETEVKDSVLGLSIPGYSMVAVFSPAIARTSVGLDQLMAVTQQIVLVHEVGHAVGLVDNGIPLQSDHLDGDENHGFAHCSNSSCVMFWQNAGFSATINALVNQSNSYEHILFGPECVYDSEVYLRGINDA